MWLIYPYIVRALHRKKKKNDVVVSQVKLPANNNISQNRVETLEYTYWVNK